MSRHNGFDEFRFAEPEMSEEGPEVTLEMELAMTMQDMEMAVNKMGLLLCKLEKQGRR